MTTVPPAPESIHEPSDADLIWASASDITARIRAREVTVAHLAEVMIERIRAVNPAINALVHVDEGRIRRDAAALDEKLAAGSELGALFGVPYTVKELTPVAGVPYTLGGFAMLKDNIAREDALIVKRLRDADGLYLGQTNSPEAGYCGVTSNQLYGFTRNPWNPELTPGGSSGGAGAAVAAGIGPIAEGTDAGGSIRVPAAFNGVVGFKPTTGTIPHTLLPARFLTNLTHGVIGRSVGDVGRMVKAARGYHASDPLARHATPENAPGSDPDLSGWRVAYSPDLGFADVDPEVAALCRDAAEVFRELGADLVEAQPDWERLDDATWMALWVPGLAGLRDLVDWPTMRGRLSDDLIDLVLSGDELTATDVARGEALRGAAWDAFASFMTDHRLLVSPTTSVAAFAADARAPDSLASASLRDRLIGWSLTHPFNLTASPAISVPCGFTSDGRPVGLQIAGRIHADSDVLRAAAAFEKARPWQGRRPQL